ncbi:WD domain G-beta repeat [Aspergillus parasiticus SU-1]|uniref:WD domain G-beta repeat n=4 Tax=Aspergillus subgen. Circumdati TaxID=2720871 RepID=A0A0F0ILZ3_ASPPU|nr:WD domain G-beta repeat [Aspergillus parasiticus SU-1]
MIGCGLYTLVSSAEGSMVVWEFYRDGKNVSAEENKVDIDTLSAKAADTAISELVSDHGWRLEEDGAKAIAEGFKTTITSRGHPCLGETNHLGRQICVNSTTQNGMRDAETLPCVNIWDVEAKVIRHRLLGHTDTIMWVATSPDSTLVASISWDGTTRIWDADDGTCLQVLGPFGQMWSGAFSPDSKYITISQGSPKTVVYVYDIEKAEEISHFEGCEHWARSLNWSPDGKLLADAGKVSIIPIKWVEIHFFPPKFQQRSALLNIHFCNLLVNCEYFNRIAMRLFVGHFVLSFLLLSLNIGCASAGINTSCLKVVTALAARPGDLFAKFQEHICDQGCRPTVPHWDLWTRNNSFLPAVRSVTKRLEAPRHEEAMIKLGDDAADIIKRRCGPLLHGGDLCSDSETLAGFGNCFKTNFVRAAIMNLPTLLPMVSEEVCREQYEYLKTDRLWEEIIPNNMKEYASVCQTLGDGVPELDHGRVHEEL